MTPTDFLLEDFLPYQLSVAALRTSRLFARHYAEAYGLSIAEWRVLAVVGRLAEATAGTVADRTEMDKVKVSRAAAALLRRGLLEHGPATADRRARPLRLTAEGARVHAGVVPMARALEAQLAGALTPDQWHGLRSSLHRLTEHLRGLDTTGAPAAEDLG